MLPIQTRIDRTQRLLRRLEEDAPLLVLRLRDLNPERQRSAKDYAARLIAETRSELLKLIQESSHWDSNDSTPHAAD
jgi:hypothetical protein